MKPTRWWWRGGCCDGTEGNLPACDGEDGLFQMVQMKIYQLVAQGDGVVPDGTKENLPAGGGAHGEAPSGTDGNYLLVVKGTVMFQVEQSGGEEDGGVPNRTERKPTRW
jgi:hypothetical protein